MDADFWQVRWDEGRTAFHQPQVHPKLAAHAAKAVPDFPAPVLVPLAGKTLDMRWLADQGCRVVGNELIELAVQQFFEEQRLTANTSAGEKLERYEAEELDLTVLRGSVFDLKPRDVEGVRWVYDRASLVALPPESRQRYGALLKALLPRATLFVITFVYDEQEMSGPPFSVAPDEVEALFDGHRFTCLEDEEVLREGHPMRAQLSSLREVVLVGEPQDTSPDVSC